MTHSNNDDNDKSNVDNNDDDVDNNPILGGIAPGMAIRRFEYIPGYSTI